MANFENFLEYQKKWTNPKLLSDLDKFVANFLELKAQEVKADTVNNTPVDTGALRAAWQIGKLRKQGNSYMIDFINNQDYASYVEYGTVEREWKWKNGAFMLTKALNRVQNNLQKDFDKKFTKFLKDKGIGK